MVGKIVGQGARLARRHVFRTLEIRCLSMVKAACIFPQWRCRLLLGCWTCSQSSLHFLHEGGWGRPPKAWIWRRNAMRTVKIQRTDGKKQPARWAFGCRLLSFGAACAADFEKQPATPREKRYNTPVVILGTRHAANGILPPKSPAERFELSGRFSFFIAAAKRCDDRVIRLLPRIGRCGR